MSKTEEESPDELSLNAVLRQMDKDLYFEECNRDIYDTDRTAFDIIALINGFSHHKLNIFKNSQGQMFARTALGFKPLVVYNTELENSRIRKILAIQENKISICTEANAKLKTFVQLKETEAQVYRERIENLIKELQNERNKNTVLKKENIDKTALLKKAENNEKSNYRNYMQKLDSLAKELKNEKEKTAILNNINDVIQAGEKQIKFLTAELQSERGKNIILNSKLQKKENNSTNRSRIELLEGRLKTEKYAANLMKKENDRLKAQLNDSFSVSNKKKVISDIRNIYSILELAIETETSLSSATVNFTTGKTQLQQINTILHKAIYDVLMQTSTLETELNNLFK